MSSTTSTPSSSSNYSFGHWAIAVIINTLLVGGIAFMQDEANKDSSFYINVHSNSFGIFATPFVLGLGLAACNRSALSVWAFLVLPILFCLAEIVAFGGLIMVQNGKMQQGDMWIMDVLVENVPFVLAFWLMYRVYAWLAGGGSIPIALGTMFWGLLMSLALWQKLITDTFLLQLACFGVLAALLSTVHLINKKI